MTQKSIARVHIWSKTIFNVADYKLVCLQQPFQKEWKENTVMVNKWLELKDDFQLLPFLFFHFYDVDFQKKTFLDFRKNILHVLLS